MILTVSDIFPEEEVGDKARVLQQLHSAGYLVPSFIVLPVSSLKDLSALNKFLLEKITILIPSQYYAVRSAALIEDNAQSAMAGQFLTKLALPVSELMTAITEVMSQAQAVPGFSEGALSIIVQEFIEPNFAGVLFTRNPLGGHEQVCEYVKGRGERVVSGQVVEQKQFFTAQEAEDTIGLPWAGELYAQAKEIEKLFGTPQDIEWAYKDQHLYILQSRNITSLVSVNPHCYEYLDTHLPEQPFFFEKTSTTETFSRPTPLALSFLRFLYAKNGPIAEVYRSIGITYAETDQFIQVGNELYVDRQAETKALFPALGFIKQKSQRPRIESVSGLWTTLKNTQRLRRIQTKTESINQSLLFAYLCQAPRENLEALMNDVKAIYPEVFRINLYGQSALGKLQAMAHDPELVEKLLLGTHSTVTIAIKKSQVAGKLVGNSISVDDTSTFFAQEFLSQPVKNNVPAGWKEKALFPQAVAVQNLMQLRELGRWVSVKLSSELREVLKSVTADQTVLEPELLYYATIFEIQDGLPEEVVLEERKRDYQRFSNCTFPAILANYSLKQTTQIKQVLSPGEAVGVLCTVGKHKEVIGPKILLVDILTPNLTSYFSEVEGIVCKQGGLLSHLAVMAREAGLPVAQTSQLIEGWLGEVVEINAKGVVQKRL